MVRICAIAGKESGTGYGEVYRRMPAKLVFSFEHNYYVQNGIRCTLWGETGDELADMLNSLHS